jgi:hypothetical protein
MSDRPRRERSTTSTLRGAPASVEDDWQPLDQAVLEARIASYTPVVEIIGNKTAHLAALPITKSRSGSTFSGAPSQNGKSALAPFQGPAMKLLLPRIPSPQPVPAEAHVIMAILIFLPGSKNAQTRSHLKPEAK